MHMESDYEYYLEADLDKYRGKWVIIVDRRVVASGTKEEMKTLLKEVMRKYPRSTPLIAKIPENVAQIVSLIS